MARVEGKGPGEGGGINEQFVDKEGRAGTRALAESDQQHAVEEGTAFTFLSDDGSAQAGEETWYLKNDGDNLHIDRIEVSTDTSGTFRVMRQTSGTAAGTVMLGRNMIAGRGDMSDVTAFGSNEVSGSVDGDDIVVHDIPTSTPYTFQLDGYILPSGQAVFVRTVVNGAVLITGFVHREG